MPFRSRLRPLFAFAVSILTAVSKAETNATRQYKASWRKKSNQFPMTSINLAFLLLCTSLVPPGRAARSLLQSFPAMTGYQLQLNQDSPGNDISFNYGLSFASCAALCTSNPSCVGFDMIISGPSAGTSTLCIPKKGLSTYQLFMSGNVGSFYKKGALIYLIAP